MNTKPETWTLTFRDARPDSVVPFVIRVRKLLKYALRALGLRCIELK